LSFEVLFYSNLIVTFVVLNRVREGLVKRGATTIRGLGRTFRALDSYDGNRKVDAGEFFVGLQEHGVKLSKAESDVKHFLENRIFRLCSLTLTLMVMAVSTLMSSSLELE
jgi:hypothetical protein